MAYLSAEELCRRSGLSPDDLERLQEAGLLRPDRPGGRYRPKLASWATKLAYLLGEGWSLREIGAWARGRWQTPDPRQWPPERERWR
ncbi:MAG: MerR family transcriptional regulator [Anaerolineae bacterium]|nr:MerR family transcriptional regulator [Anaerolineae bacterium]